jgi:putative DNA primase/helicase
VTATVIELAKWTGPYGEPRRTKVKTEAERAADRDRWIAIRREGRPFVGTPGETYFRSRGQRPDITLYPPNGWPSAIRWSEDLIRKPTPPVKPGIIIDVCDPQTGEVNGIHRIIFRRDGTVEKDADGKKSKFCLGSIWGNAVMLGTEPANSDREWGVAEGVETAMACRLLYRIPVWAAVFGGNMAEITPPVWARRIIVFADHDFVNKEGYRPGFRFAARAWNRWRTRHGIESVRVLQPECEGSDFADVLKDSPYEG